MLHQTSNCKATIDRNNSKKKSSLEMRICSKKQKQLQTITHLTISRTTKRAANHSRSDANETLVTLGDVRQKAHGKARQTEFDRLDLWNANWRLVVVDIVAVDGFVCFLDSVIVDNHFSRFSNQSRITF